MRIFILMSLIVFSTTSVYASQILTESDKTEVLSIIDRVCADSWCAGDYDYKFTTFSCNDQKELCTLSFKIIDRDAHSKVGKVRNRRCNFKGIKNREMIFSGHNLAEEFYDQLNVCITDRESN